MTLLKLFWHNRRLRHYHLLLDMNMQLRIILTFFSRTYHNQYITPSFFQGSDSLCKERIYKLTNQAHSKLFRRKEQRMLAWTVLLTQTCGYSLILQLPTWKIEERFLILRRWLIMLTTSEKINIGTLWDSNGVMMWVKSLVFSHKSGTYVGISRAILLDGNQIPMD